MMHMSQAKGKSQASKGKHLKNSLEYILNPEKTEMGTLISGSHILPDADFAFEKMLETKRIMNERFGYKKTEGRQGYHFVLSFSPKDNITPEMAMEITEKFIKNYIPDYESVYAVHTDRKHLHSHIVFNSVNLINGQKYRYENGDWAKIIQPITNQLCEEYGLSTIKLEDYNGKPKKKTITQLIQEDVEECLKKVKSKTQFDHEMEKRGYTIKRKGAKGQDLKNVTVIPPKTGDKEPKGHRLKGEQKEIFDSLPEHFKDIKTEKKKTTEKKAKDKKENILSDKATGLLLSQINAKKKQAEHKGGADWEEDRMDKDGTEEEFEEESYQEEKQGNQQYKHQEKNTNRSTYSGYGEAKKREKIFYHVKFKQTKVKVDMAGRYLIRDLRYRKNGRYYREYVKFDLTRRKIKYLHNHSIKTMEDLRNRKDALQKAAERLESMKKRVWEERFPYKKLFGYYKRLEALRIPVQLYRDGDTTFSEEYKEMRELIDKIHKSGMKLEELKALYERIHGQLSEIGKLEHELKREMALCEAIEKDSLQHKKQTQQLEQSEKKQTKRKVKTR